EGVPAPEERCVAPEAAAASAASPISERRPEDAWVVELGDSPRDEPPDAPIIEFDSLPEPSSVCWAEKDAERPVSPSRFTRFKSARMSEAFWQRRCRSFSRALLMTSSA